MPIGWISMLKMVPWGDVISNAPKVADGAKKLWGTAAKRPPGVPVPEAGVAPPGVSAEAQAITVLQAQVKAADTAIAELHEQMLASSELIGALADQNTQLIQRVETGRIRLLWLAGASGVLGAVAVAALALALLR